MKKLLPLLLSVCMLLPAFSGCGKNRRLTIIKDDTCEVFYDADTVSSSTLRALTNALEEATGSDIKPASKGDIQKGAILLGNVILPDGTLAAGDLRNKDYKVGIEGDYYLIGGVTESTTAEAVDYFVESVLPLLKNGKLRVAAKNDMLSVGEYPIEGITVGGVAPGQFSIVTSASPSISELRTAVELKSYLSGTLGYAVNVTDDKSVKTTAQIRVGQSLCETATAANAHDYAITVKGTTMEIAAESYLGYAAALDALKSNVFSRNNEKPAIDDSSSWSGNGADLAKQPLASTGDVRVMFNNIHGHPADGDNPMPVEQPTQMLSELYLEYLPDVIGLQECTENSYNAGILNLLGSEYAITDEKGPTPILYRKSTVECLVSGDFRFNSITDEEYGGARRNDASKGVTWAIFKVKTTGKLFAVGSTHLWWKHESSADETCRAVQAQKIVEVLTEQTNSFASSHGLLENSIPILVGGDYNTSLIGDKYGESMLKTDAISPFVDANDLASVKATRTSHHGYATYNEKTGIYDTPKYVTASYTSALDHILAGNTSSITVKRVSVLDELYAYLSSDHNPIFTDISFTAASPNI